MTPYDVVAVTHDSAPDVAGWLAAVAALVPPPARAVMVDCGSRDDSVAVARAAWPEGLPGAVVELGENRGFTGGANVGIGATGSAWVLLLNPDARPAPDFAARLLERAEADGGSRVGAVTGRLVRPADAAGVVRLDACGMRLRPTWRHLDRGSGEVDRGQLSRPERVFGGTGAATLLRRAALDDVAVAGAVLDESFHSFREDAELAFRLRERGWEILYEPTAVCEHRRFNLPSRRRAMPAAVNFHSLKNRYLLRLVHETPWSLLLTLPWALARDVAALVYALAVERSSLPAYGWIWRHRREILARRATVQGRRTVPARELARWFFRDGVPIEPGGEERP